MDNRDIKITLALSLPGTLGLIFIFLKLFKVITWSWLWVLSPFWISFFVFGLITIVFIAIQKKAGKW